VRNTPTACDVRRDTNSMYRVLNTMETGAKGSPDTRTQILAWICFRSPDAPGNSAFKNPSPASRTQPRSVDHKPPRLHRCPALQRGLPAGFPPLPLLRCERARQT